MITSLIVCLALQGCVLSVPTIDLGRKSRANQIIAIYKKKKKKKNKQIRIDSTGCQPGPAAKTVQ